MSRGIPRYRLSREEIGLMLSFAKRPEAITPEWIRRLEAGVDRPELTEFVALAGLPRDSVRRIVDDGSGGGPLADDGSTPGSRSYRRAMIGIVVLYVFGAVTLSIATVDDTSRSLMLGFSFALSGWLLYRVIVRLSRNTG